MARITTPSLTAVKAPFQSKETFVSWLEAPVGTEDGRPPIGDPGWSNMDLEPTPPEQRTWTWFNLPMYWFSTMFGITGWNVAAALIVVGLTWQQAFISCILGALLASVVVVAMARPGAKYHIGYPVLARSVVGMYGAYFFVFIRAVVCIVWFGIQTFYGGNLLSVCFRCIFGDSWHLWPNTLPAGADVTSKQLLAFFLVWLLKFPFTWVHPTKIHYIFTVKGVIMPIACLGLFGWCMASGTGVADINKANVDGHEAASSTPLGWAIMSGINVIMGSLSPMLVNQPDLARYVQKPRDAGLLQGVCVFFGQVLVFFLGLASTTSIQGKWGEAYWNPWDLLDAILDHYWTPGGRAGVFFVSLSFLFAVFATNLGCNSIPFGADMTGLFPRWLTIKRGQILCAILGVAVVPWKLIAGAEAFLSFLGSYNIFMAPLCAIIIVDYFFNRKGNLHVPAMFRARKGGLYWFWSGVNWVAVFSWVSGVVMGLPGLVGQYQPQIVSQAAKYMYMMGWQLTFVASAVVYMVCLQFFFKPRVLPDGCAGLADAASFEWLANDGREGFLDGERPVAPGSESAEDVIYAPPTPTGAEEGSGAESKWSKV
ncbi:hypothetical protein PspLS_11542 [Pyricularia sp. CBS 133598]|nr:hypothetical protein PspLS_11542 [Pyricularia sp. CBS 133598]